MDVEFKDPSLDRLETNSAYSAEFGNAVVKAYRRRMQQSGRLATNERSMRCAR